MGMYTGLRCKVIIKPEFRKDFQMLSENLYKWNSSNVDFIKEFSEVERNNFIPLGSVNSMPGSWEKAPYDKYGSGVPEDGFDRNFDANTGLWTFQCSLKNYEDTIEKFIEKVLKNVVQEIIHLEQLHQDSEYSLHYVSKEDGSLDTIQKEI
jgi:hypothetical protein